MVQNLKEQRGAAAIFIVVFFAILISIIMLSFLRIASQDQQQATNNDLSQSAYDSASAGLEDAKRALSWYDAHCPLDSAPAATDVANCTAYNTALNAPDNRCNITDIITNSHSTIPGSVVTAGREEVKILSTPGDDKLDQAYTCVTITTQTKDFKGEAKDGKSDTLIPLRTVNNESIDTIEINWFSNKNPENPLTPSYNDSAGAKPLPTSNTSWQPTTPPIMRFQLIPVLRGNVNINNVNADTRTVFLYPSTTGSSTIGLAAVDQGRTPVATEKPTAPNLAKCDATVDTGSYACNMRINQLPLASGGVPSPNTTDYFLRITSIYNDTDYQIRLLGDSGTNLRLFNNVEPQIDTTGRANNVFRRVQSRVRNLPPSNPLTDGGFDITRGLCKDFNVPVYSTNCPTSTPSLVNP
jgi:hypothetical protein